MASSLQKHAVWRPTPSTVAAILASRRTRRWLLTGLMFFAIGLIETMQAYLMRDRYGSPAYWRILLWMATPWVFWALVAPAVLMLGRRFPLGQGAWRRHLPLHLIALTLITIPHFMLSTWLGIMAGHRYYVQQGFWNMLEELLQLSAHMDVLTYAVVLAGGYAFDYRDRLHQKEVQAAQLQTKLVEAQLSALKMQLHPHFLFNTLHAIGVLIRKQNAKASVKMLAELSDMLRLSLDNAGKQKVSLDEELVFVEHYLNIERMRLGDRLTVRVDIPITTRTAIVPNLVLQPLVENSIKHGIATRKRGGSIDISARRDVRRLRLLVRDDGVGLPADWRLEDTKGVGLANVRARLEQLYPGRCVFTVDRVEEGGVCATIDLPLELAEGEDP